MKKATSILLILAMVLSLGVTALAAGYTTEVSYTGEGVETFRIVVPATLAPGASSNVEVSGAWPSYKAVTVTADQSVRVVNSIDQKAKNLAVEFAGVTLFGSNESPVSAVEPIAIGEIENALFGTWRGTITYNVSWNYDMVDSLVGTSWKFNHSLTDYSTAVGLEDDREMKDVLPDGSMYSCTYEDPATMQTVVYEKELYGFARNNIGGFDILGFVQSSGDEYGVAYTPLAMGADIPAGWYLFKNTAWHAFQNGTLPLEEFVNVANANIVPIVTAPVIVFENEVVDDDNVLKNEDFIGWLYQNAVMQ